MAAATKRTDDFTFAELVEYEELIGESIDDIRDDEKPRLKKIATLGWLRAKREQADLKFIDYMNDTDPGQIVIDAFGNQEDEEEKKEQNSDKPARSARRGSA